jgi:hypothetical protein
MKREVTLHSVNNDQFVITSTPYGVIGVGSHAAKIITLQKNVNKSSYEWPKAYSDYTIRNTEGRIIVASVI